MPWRSVLRLVLPTVVAILPGYAASLLAVAFIEHTFTRLVVEVAVTVGLFAVSLFLFGYFDEFDVKTLRGILRNARGIVGSSQGGAR